MMVQSTPFTVLGAALLINTLSLCSAEIVYCVAPNATSCSSCPENAHCANLTEYAQHTELYFISNTTMVFLPGDHVLDTNITVANIDELTMCGESSTGNIPTVVCSGSVGLSFTSMMAFKIHSLAFTSCSRKYVVILPGIIPNFVTVHAALHVQSTQFAILVNCFFYDNDGTALVVSNTNIILAGNNFTHNSAQGSSIGAILAYNTNITDNTVLSFRGINNFINNSAGYGGGAIYASNNTELSFSGTNNFISNSAGINGGAICTYYNTTLCFNGTNHFINNSAAVYGGTIYASDNTTLIFIGANNFIKNSAGVLGGAIYISNIAVLSFNGSSNFINNSAQISSGGAIYLSENALLSFNGISCFINNSADVSGGAIYTSQNTVLNFSEITNYINNSAGYGGAIFSSQNTVLSFNGTNSYINNSAGNLGGAIYALKNTVLSFNGTSNFINNSADYSSAGGAIYTFGDTILGFNGTSNFNNNSADSGGAIYTSINDTLIFNGTIYFTNNGYHGVGVDTQYGGGMYIGLKTTFSILLNTTLYWENNHANLGGAIYVEDASPTSYCTPLAPYIPKDECFFQLPGRNVCKDVDVQLIFKDNSADVAGSALYGGAIDHCKLTHGLDSCNSGEVFNKLVYNIDTDYNTTSNISSNPLHICLCENSLPNCKVSQYDYPCTVYPGETFQVSVAAVGQRDGTVPSQVISIIDQGVNPGRLLDSEHLQQVNTTCTDLKYTVLSLSQSVDIELQAGSSPCSNLENIYRLDISANINQNCPPGFNISKLEKSCVCEPRLAKYTHQCTIINEVGQITRDLDQHFWVVYDNQLILHPLCPFDYCVAEKVVFPLNNSDVQCAHNRSGFLCGACKENFSLVLGTSYCKQCTNSHLFLVIPFALMGVVLIFFLFVCKLTVATGTLSGLVFYVNIFCPNRTIFLPVESTNPFLVFIAWLNLDFGIETCFYNGMNTYSETWLQFVFPVYIWMLVGLMIFISHFSQKFAKLLGNNPVSVLATLILLSYTKILRNLITVLYVTYLQYPKYNRSVWLYDANIDYLTGKHIPLFLVAVLAFLFLFLPYTLLLLSGQWLQAISDLRLFSWVNRLKPFMDSYHAPYKANHRYWPGLLLLLRFALLLVFAIEFNPQQNSSIKLLTILVGTGLIQMWAWVSGGVYKNWCLDALESSFVLNLIILAAATYHVQLSGGNQLAVGYTSVSIALATFIGIFIIQLANVTGIAQYLKNKCARVAIRNKAEAEVEPLDNDSLPDRLINPEQYELPFYTPQEHNIAEPTEGVNEEQRRLVTPVYTYGSID